MWVRVRLRKRHFEKLCTRTDVSACKITKKSLFLATYLFWLGWLDWVLPLKNSRVLLAMLRLKHHVSLSELLSLTFVFANYPLRTKLVRLKTTLSNKKILHKRRTFLLAGVAGFEPTNDDTKNRCLTTWRHPNVWALIMRTGLYVN